MYMYTTNSIGSMFQHCINQKVALFYENTQKLQMIMNTASLSKGLLSRIGKLYGKEPHIMEPRYCKLIWPFAWPFVLIVDSTEHSIGLGFGFWTGLQFVFRH